jgi:hypothetical protein
MSCAGYLPIRCAEGHPLLLLPDLGLRDALEVAAGNPTPLHYGEQAAVDELQLYRQRALVNREAVDWRPDSWIASEATGR